MTTRNTAWLGPDLNKCEAAFTAAFVPQPPLFDLLIASRNYGNDTGDVHARVTWLKEAGKPKETPKRLTLADMLPKLAEFTLVETQKTGTEIIRKYRRLQ